MLCRLIERGFMTDTKKLLGLRIKEIRKLKGYTQSELAEAIEVDPKHLSRIESGVNYPSMVALVKMANKLGVELKELFVFKHLEKPAILLNEITSTLINTDDDKLRLYYRVLKDLTL
jgi:transcriptional regulator with XRE-family HTH domain